MANCQEDMDRKKNEEKDEELEELLDSALEDFNQTPVKQNCAKPSEVQSTSSPKPGNEENLWNDEFSQEAQKEFEEKLKTLFGQESKDGDISLEQFSEHLQKMAEEAANTVLTEHSRDPEFSETIAQTLRGLSENTERMNEMDPEVLSNMLGSLDIGGSEGDVPNDFMPFMQTMMQSLLSKDVLYPSIKEVTEKYPTWLEEHKLELSEADFDGYQKQFQLMDRVCTEFESEKDTDSSQLKKERFSKILSLMDEMQKLGQPPKELVGNTPFTLNENGLPNALPGMDQSQCSLM